MHTFHTDSIGNKFIQTLNNNLIYEGFIFYKYEKYIPKIYRKENIIFYRCKDFRKDERYRNGFGYFL